MKCINFDERFADFTAKWMKEHRGEYKTYDEMEDDLPRVYTEFLNTPAKWLDGVTPGAYFTQFEDAKDLVDWMVQYCQKDIPVPDMLMEQIQAVGRPCEKRLLTLLRDESDAIPEEARMTAIGLLRDMGSTLPKMLYIQWQLNREMKDDLADNALDSLRDMGKEALQPMLENLNKANEAGQEALLDVLANFPGHENVYQLAVSCSRRTRTAAPCSRAIWRNWATRARCRFLSPPRTRKTAATWTLSSCVPPSRSWVAKRRSASSTTTRNTRRCTRWTTGTMTRTCSKEHPW